MWRRGGRSNALDRAEALLSNRGRSDAVAGFTKSSPVKAPAQTVAAVSSLNSRSSLKDRQPVLSDLSDLSSISVASELGLVASVHVENIQRREEPPTVGGTGSRFLKKPLPHAAKSSPSSPGKSQAEPRSTQLSSQAAALRRLAQIESRFQTKKQVQEQRNHERAPVHDLDSDVGPTSTAMPNVSQAIFETKNHFLKKKATLAADGAVDNGLKSRTKSAEVSVVGSGEDPGLNYHVSLSDEEEIRKLLGDSMDSSDNSLLGHSSARKVNQKSVTPKALPSEPSRASVIQSCDVPSQSPASTPLRNSPFRFTGQPQSHYSPSVVSRTPSPPLSDIPSLSISSMSAPENVLSLDELFPVSERSSTPSDALYHIKVMGLDQLASPGFTETDVLQDKRDKSPVPKSPVSHQHVEDEEEVYYHSDFESETHTVASQVSEHLPEEIEEEELQKESTHDDASFTTHSESSRRSHTSGHGPASRSSSIRTKSGHSLSRSSSILSEKLFKEAAVQTHPEPWSTSWSADLTAATSAVHQINTAPLTSHNVQALQSFNPAGRALHEVFQQQLVMMRSFIERNRRLHASLMQSLEPPNYRYTTLEDTMKSIRKHRKSQPPLENT